MSFSSQLSNFIRDGKTNLSDFLFDNNEINLKIKNFEIIDIIYDSPDFNIIDLHSKGTDELYSALISNNSDASTFFTSNYLLKSINHPSICKNIINCEKDSKYTFITQHIKYKPLNEILNHNEPKLNLTNKLIIIYGIASGMSYLHSQSILHCDLKSFNILLDDRLFPKIAGFHISEQYCTEKVEGKLLIKGTPAYLAPEILNGLRKSKSSDIYSFSLLVYELLTGEKPFFDITDMKELQEKVSLKKERPIIKESISKSYRSLIEKCWSQNPKERPTFEQIIFELETDRSFITEDINEKEYRDYIKFIKESNISFDRKDFQLEKVQLMNWFYFNDFQNERKFKGLYETEMNNIPYFLKFIDINSLKNEKVLGIGSAFRCILYSDEINQTNYAVKIINEEWNEQSTRDIFYKELNISYLYEHPCIIKLIGFGIKNKDLNEFKPALVFDYYSNGNLHHLLELHRKNNINILDETRKLIIIYGIAFGMAFLHSHNIIHRELRTENIYLDSFLFPKISCFYRSQNIDLPKNNQTLQESIEKIMAPEFIRDYKTYNRTKPIDVYSFSIVIFEIMTNDEPYPNDSIYNIINNTLEGKRPIFNNDVPFAYKNLIERCWSQDPEKRPTFDDIVKELETNPEFITNNVDKDEFNKYIEYIKGLKNISFDQVLIDQIEKHLNVNVKYINLRNFVKQNKIGSGSFGKVYKVFNKKTGEIQACKISILPLESLNDDEIKNLEREINIISKLNFPSILKFVGFNPKNFKKEQRPIFITEFVSNGSLDTILDLEQKGLSNEDWNDTKKLIIIYGIASGMAYLHSHDIIHRDLKPGNIFIDEFMFQKIGDFGLSKTIKQNKDVNKKIESFSGLKGTVPFMSPEIITDNNYIKAGDVYAFAIIVHQIIVNEELFKGWFRLQIMFNIKNGYRPPIPHNIPLCYKELIEKCWNEDPKKRPTFNEIVELLKTNPDFITDTVDQNEFNDYIDYLDEIQNNHSNLLNKQFHKVSLDLKNNREGQINLTF